MDVVIQLSLRDVKDHIEKWHYSRKVPTGKNIFFGWYVNNDLYAVSNYGIGVNPYQASFLSKVMNTKIGLA